MAIKVHHLGGGMDAGVGAAGGNGAAEFGGNASGEWVEGLNRFIEALLNTAVLGLPLPATKRPPVVLQTEGDALTGQWAGAQTSSMMAISALSPRRGTVRMMRV
jgi:hypothetical protein